MKLSVLSLALLCLPFLFPTASEATVRLGVMSPTGEATAMKQWSPVAQELETLLGEDVVLIALNAGNILDQLDNGALDVVIGNPVQAALATTGMQAQAVASVVKKSGQQFGGVIVANPNAGIATAADLKGKKVMTLKNTAAGGFIFQTHYLLGFGVTSPDDFGHHAVAKNQKDIVNLVAKGAFDAGFVRTGMVDDMIARGEISEGDVIIVDRKETAGFPHAHTTILYPEWMVFAHTQYDPQNVSRMREALIKLAEGTPALEAARVQGFAAPQDLSGIIDALSAVGMLPAASN
jgi:two-component system sensor histidine kinase TtrS